MLIKKATRFRIKQKPFRFTLYETQDGLFYAQALIEGVGVNPEADESGCVRGKVINAFDTDYYESKQNVFESLLQYIWSTWRDVRQTDFEKID